jgi:hypothetical protein
MRGRIVKVNPQFGWLGETIARREWQLIGHLFPQFRITGAPPGYSTAGKALRGWEYVRKANGGKDKPNIAQEIGDCVSWGCRNAVDTLACIEIFLKGDNEEYHGSFPPYFYGCGRVFVGHQHDRQDGSVGLWQAQAVREYGALRIDFSGCPQYSGRVASDWGYDGPTKQFVDEAKQHLIGATAQIQSYEEARDAICNGYCVTVASNIGYEGTGMKGRVEHGKCFERRSGSWGHQMCADGVDDDPAFPCIHIQNSWGENTWPNQPDGAPIGGFWISPEDFNTMARQGDTFVFPTSPASRRSLDCGT